VGYWFPENSMKKDGFGGKENFLMGKYKPFLKNKLFSIKIVEIIPF